MLESLSFNKVASLKTQQSCFPVTIAKFLRTTFFIAFLIIFLYNFSKFEVVAIR